MNDNELMTLAREPFDGVHMTTPLDAIAGRGRVLRQRRRLRGLTGAVALAGGLSAAVALVPGGQPGAARPVRSGTAVLAAWTATRDPDGGITVAVNQLKNETGLQATLRADGIPVRVTFNPNLTVPLPAGCVAPKMSDSANSQVLNKMLTPPAIWAWQEQQMKRVMSIPITFTYTVNGRVEHTTVHRGGFAWYKMQQQLMKEGAKNMKVTGLGVPVVMPDSLQAIQEKEQQDATGRSALYINPAAVPHGYGISIGVDVTSPSNFSFGEDLVVASPQCTGS